MTRSELESWADARVVIVVAHPDDEVLGCGALIARLNDVTVVHVTNGAPRCGTDAARYGFPSLAAYSAARHTEALAALAIADVPPNRLHALGIADQGAPAQLVAITQALMALIEGATVVITHAYEGGHGDHDAVAFAAHAACRLSPQIALIEMPFYHADQTGWVRQRFLPLLASFSSTQGEGSPETDVLGIICLLSPADRDVKARMIAAYTTQAETLRNFSLDAERFRLAPKYRFSHRPHNGPLLYERHGWSLTWPQWTAHVKATVTKLDQAIS